MNKNLIPMNERTKEEQREIARKGGRESGKVRRRKRTMKDAAQLILQLPVGAEQAALLQKYGIAESDCTNLMLLIVKTVQMAADGNLKAVEFIRDTLGENPQYKIYEKRLEYLIADKEAATSGSPLFRIGRSSQKSLSEAAGGAGSSDRERIAAEHQRTVQAAVTGWK